MITQELIALFRACLPFVVRSDADIASAARHADSRVLTRRSGDGELIGAAIVNRETILMLCVAEPWRRQGIGSGLLQEAETLIRAEGFRSVRAGVGYTYLMPGVPTTRHRFPAVHERLDDRLTAEADDFFIRRGYRHSGDCDCFDMRFSLSGMPEVPPPALNDDSGEVLYRWAQPGDMAAVEACVGDAMPDFVPYYRSASLYGGGSGREGALLAIRGGEVAGAIIVGVDSEKDALGSIGCTCVRHRDRGQGIAAHLAHLATAELRRMGMREAWLSYTYTGLDKLYGRAGYRISVYYMMAEKELNP